MRESVRELRTDEPENIHNGAEWPNQLAAFVDGELGDVTTQQIQTHVTACVRCQAEVKALRQLTAQLASLPTLNVPRSFAISPEQAHKLNSRPLYTVARAALGMAAALLIFVFALDFLGLTNQTVSTVATTPLATPTSTIVLPPVDTRPACVPTNNQGNVICNNDDSGTVPYISTPKPMTRPPIVNSNAFVGIRLVEISLIVLVLALAAFALAVRPRAPSKIRL